MAIRCACVIRGVSTPFVVLATSNAALAFGVAVPIPTCALAAKDNEISKVINVLFMTILRSKVFVIGLISLSFELKVFPTLHFVPALLLSTKGLILHN